MDDGHAIWVFILPTLWALAITTDDLRKRCFLLFASVFVLSFIPPVLAVFLIVSARINMLYKSDVAIIGGTGFIGRHLIVHLREGETNIYLLTRSSIEIEGVNTVQGDLLNLDTLRELIKEGSIVANLAFLSERSEKENLQVIDNLLKVSLEKNVTHLIHLSTAVVVGKNTSELIDERSSCCPASSYEDMKFKIEEQILSCSLRSTILRPTCVFGEGGENLKKLFSDLKKGPSILNDLRRSLYGRRRMNLVPVSFVTSAIKFLLERGVPQDSEIFIVAADEQEENNFRFVESRVREKMQMKEGPFFEFPSQFLMLLLRIVGKKNIFPFRKYSSQKLHSLGWTPPKPFLEELESFINYESTKY